MIKFSGKPEVGCKPCCEDMGGVAIVIVSKGQLPLAAPMSLLLICDHRGHFASGN